MTISPLAQTIFHVTSTAHGAYSDKELAVFEVQGDRIDQALHEIASSVRSSALVYFNDAHKEAFERTLKRKVELNQFADHVLPSTPNWWKSIADS